MFDIYELILEQNDDRQQLSEEVWTLEWYDSKKGKWDSTEFTSPSIAKKAESRTRTILRGKGDNNPDHVVLKRGKRTSMFTR